MVSFIQVLIFGDATMKKKIDLIETIVAIINILLVIIISLAQLLSFPIGFLFTAIVLAIMLLVNMLVGVVVILIRKLWTPKCFSLLALYVLQIIIYIFFIASTNISLAYLCFALSVPAAIMEKKFLPKEDINNDLPS